MVSGRRTKAPQERPRSPKLAWLAWLAWRSLMLGCMPARICAPLKRAACVMHLHLPLKSKRNHITELLSHLQPQLQLRR